MKQMRKGIYIAEGFVRVEGAKLLKSRSRSTEMEVVLREGKNREIRRILARLGHKVQHLRRIAVGPLRLGDVPPGAYRVVSRQEVERLWQATESSADPKPGKRGRRFAGKPTARKKLTRRPTKKGRHPRQARTEDLPRGQFDFGASQTAGVVIGSSGESSSSSGVKRFKKAAKGKRGTKRPSTTGRAAGGKNSNTPAARGGSRKRAATKRKRKK